MDYKVGDRIFRINKFNNEFGINADYKGIIVRIKNSKNLNMIIYSVRYKIGNKYKNVSLNENDFTLDKQYYRNLKLSRLLNEL